MDAIITAGGIPQPGEPLYEYTQGQCKALLDIGGKPMIQWVLDAVCGSRFVENLVIIGLPPDSPIVCDKVGAFIPNQGGMLQNIKAGVEKVLELNPNAKHVLAVSSDIPGITSTMVDWVINKALETDDDLYYNVITKETMEARYPNSNRSYIKLKGAQVCGGDMNIIRATTVTGNEELWEKIIAARKNAFKQASLLGYDTLILLLLRMISLENGVKMASRRLKIKGRVLVCPFAEVGMDVDKPHQLELMRADFAQRVAA